MKKLSQENLIKQFRVIVDSREQLPYRFQNSITKGLPTGDYTIQYDNRSYEDRIVCERKSRVGELYAATGRNRERWERELERLSKIEFRYVILEMDWLDIVNKQPPGLLESSCVYGSIIDWHIKYNIPFLFLHNRTNARMFIWKLFYFFTEKEILGIHKERGKE